MRKTKGVWGSKEINVSGVNVCRGVEDNVVVMRCDSLWVLASSPPLST